MHVHRLLRARVEEAKRLTAYAGAVCERQTAVCGGAAAGGAHAGGTRGGYRREAWRMHAARNLEHVRVARPLRHLVEHNLRKISA